MGACDIKFCFANGSSFVLKNIHVPKLTKSLIIASQLDDSGYQTTFGSLSWKIQKGSISNSALKEIISWKPFRVYKVFQQSDRFKEEELDQLLVKIKSTDIMLKSSTINPEILLFELAVTIAES